MFAIADSGTLLPVYVCYKAKGVWDTWGENGPQGAIYRCSPSGWFTRDLFWFFNVIVP